MIEQLLASDTAKAAGVAAGKVAEEAMAEWVVMLGALLMPFILLIVFSLIKGLVGVKVDEVDWYDFFAELAIDLLSIFSSFIIGRYILENSSSGVLIGSFEVIGIFAIGVLILSFVRRLVKKLCVTSNANMSCVKYLVMAEYGVDLFCLFLFFLFI